MNIPAELLYTKEHEWVKFEDDVATIGITDYAQGELGDIVFVELPQVGDTIRKGETFGTIEAVKAVSDLYSPLDGEVLEVNSSLEDAPETINSSPYEDGWMLKIQITESVQKNDLLSADEYKKIIDEA
ncbi:glycine cleavage system protein H [candidate division LCP-89 bacterium B3_LCP]|uniref:Glycine cleavage system H protein n=1 Tax=candidate division LCP-89 bacterium B3_LCP TaxID=2012998 RepID=A0A532V3L7_UNCL8|nr:MAG: glycine cleavage system protein H [candidate division LCP-89 bacterium B3_LCP]